ncbi:MAG: hypothetical protein K6A92_01990 [Lachnospiraceae bacterium]|nr:hypothetical protein [Lachnospiraceae bacterium]
MGTKTRACFHLPGLFEFYKLYKIFLPLYREHPEYFYDWCEIASIYGAPADCLWGGGRVGFGDADPKEVADLMADYGISARLTFSNSLLREEHLADPACNALCRLFEHNGQVPSGVILTSELLLSYLRKQYPDFYLVSSTTKVLTDFEDLEKELSREEFRYVVPDFRLNNAFEKWKKLPKAYREKVEFLCNECCDLGCPERKICYENVSRKSLGEACEDHICTSPQASGGYRFSDAMESPAFIGLQEIQSVYVPEGYTQYKIEGRSLGSALILELLLYYLTKPEYQLKVREAVYLDSMLDLF